MSTADFWLLPEGIEDMLPPAARHLERLRRDLLDLYESWGYQLVIPPLVEFLESLLTGVGKDLDLQTFKLIDQLSGRLMGVRADMTPQVARIDAHYFSKQDIPTRFCYMGTVLHTRSPGVGNSRSPFQVGAELYGHGGYESDLEVLLLMLETLTVAGVTNVHLDLGHVGIFRNLARQTGLNPPQEEAIFEALQRKALPEIDELLTDYALPAELRELFLALAELNGGEEVLQTAENSLAAADEEVWQALEALHQTAAAIQHRLPELPIHFDLAELRGYRYHTGLVFAAYAPGHGQALAQGGRYDGIVRAFKRSRPATGFSAHLDTLLALAAPRPAPAKAIYAPEADDPALEALVNELRSQRERVIRALPGADPGPKALGCNRMLVTQDDSWVVAPVEGCNG